jgi:DNA-binding Lrp family transcriptional regulator
MKKVLEALPADFPVSERPYDEMAREMGMSGAALIDELVALKKVGIIRRIAAMVAHRSVSYEGNAMVVWRVPEAELEKVGTVMAGYDEVSHCYERDTGGYWDYNLYTMVHGRTKEECLATVGRMSSRSGIVDYRVLFSLREFKKTSFAVRK